MPNEQPEKSENQISIVENVSEREKFKYEHEAPNAHDREILELIIEECSEVIQRCTKAMRFGLNECQPEQEYDNSIRLAHEIGDLLEVIDLAMQERMVGAGDVASGRLHKRKKLDKYLKTLCTVMGINLHAGSFDPLTFDSIALPQYLGGAMPVQALLRPRDRATSKHLRQTKTPAIIIHSWR